MADREPRLSGAGLKVLGHFLRGTTEPQAGADISRATGVGAGTLYPLLARLEDAGWFTSVWEEVDPSEAGRPRKRLYRLTALGQRKARGALSEYQVPGLVGGVVWAS